MGIRSSQELSRSTARPVLIALCVLAGAWMLWMRFGPANPALAASTSVSTATASPASAAEHDNTQQGEAILSFLSGVVDWYRHITVEAQLVTDPAEMLYVTDDRTIANEVVSLAFQYARAEAAAIAAAHASAKQAAKASAKAAGAKSGLSLGNVNTRLSQMQSALAQTQAKVDDLKNQVARARGRARTVLSAQLDSAQEELQLDQARVDSVKQILDFEQSAEKTRASSGLMAQIDELERTVPPRSESTNLSPAAINATRTDHQEAAGGILGLAEQLLALRNKDQALSATVAQTAELNSKIDKLREPLLDKLRAADQHGLDLSTKAEGGNLAAVEQRRQVFAALLQERKLMVAAILPITKASVDLSLYQANLERWRQALGRNWDEALRELTLRLIVLASLIGSIAIGAVVWRRLAFRYIQDARQRHRVLQLRTLIVVALIVLVLLFNFSNEIGALATVMGLATAGIAFALQNVILSVAGYFFLSGKYGLRVGDRVQLGGVYGTVIDIGLVKLTLMELSGEGNFRQPTGRVVVFANSIVFQANGNFFKQAPGISFVWNEFRLMLSPDCDYLLAEKLLMNAVNDVFATYREDLRREYRESGQLHAVWFEPPEPQSRIQLGADGVRIVIRYPVEARQAVAINDELSRRLLNVIDHEPRLRLVGSGTPTIQAVQVASGDGTQAGVTASAIVHAPPAPGAPNKP
ncbi:MAG TPA: mechanosensitive ion channel domain-containing protein [Candidatus Binataceae bacterium]|nr:mechanosensitive ion channel domain-containing protein [Candidatus Binataceae bacterium]